MTGGGALRATEPIGLTWLVVVRWTTVAAGVAAIAAGRRGLDAEAPVTAAVAVLALLAVSNGWLMVRVRRATGADGTTAGVLLCADVVLLSWVLLRSGGVLNPVSAFYLVQIVVAALVLGRTWTWTVTALSVAGYATLFLAETDDLRAAQGMHPEIGAHIRGMWLAFALVAIQLSSQGRPAPFVCSVAAAERPPARFDFKPVGAWRGRSRRTTAQHTPYK
jgi:two-component system sensor histidine kinase RegB